MITNLEILEELNLNLNAAKLDAIGKTIAKIAPFLTVSKVEFDKDKLEGRIETENRMRCASFFNLNPDLFDKGLMTHMIKRHIEHHVYNMMETSLNYMVETKVNKSKYIENPNIPEGYIFCHPKTFYELIRSGEIDPRRVEKDES